MYSMKRVLGLLVAVAVSAGSFLVAAPGASAAYPGLEVTPPVASVSATVGVSSEWFSFRVTNTGAVPVMMDSLRDRRKLEVDQRPHGMWYGRRSSAR